MNELEEVGDGVQRPVRSTLPIPRVEAILELAGPSKPLSKEAGRAVLDALRKAAEARVAGVLGQKRRNHYEHAAMLVACVRELLLVTGDATVAARWVASIRSKYSRFPRFRSELERAGV